MLPLITKVTNFSELNSLSPFCLKGSLTQTEQSFSEDPTPLMGTWVGLDTSKKCSKHQWKWPKKPQGHHGHLIGSRKVHKAILEVAEKTSKHR